MLAEVCRPLVLATLLIGVSPAVATTPLPVETLENQISSAPGRGMIPGISDRSGASALLYALEAQPSEDFSPLLSRRYIHGTQSTFVKWTAREGAVVGLHYHPNEQISWIVSGRAEVFSNGRRYIAEAGDILFFPPNVPHEFRFLEDTVNIDFFAPGRQDWMDGDDTYMPR